MRMVLLFHQDMLKLIALRFVFFLIIGIYLNVGPGWA